MTRSSPIPAQQQDKVGPGRLILVVGPSGAGKDTLIDIVRGACKGDDKIVFPQRIITREASSSERNVCISATDFAAAAANNEFALHWQAHGLQYALPRSMMDDVRTGHTVVVNISRTVITRVREIYQNVTVVLVTASADILTARLSGRARVSDGDIGHRLNRAIESVIPDMTIHNVGPAEQHGRELLKIVRHFA